jgi:hypothetical protein
MGQAGALIVVVGNMMLVAGLVPGSRASGHARAGSWARAYEDQATARILAVIACSVVTVGYMLTRVAS